VEAREADDLAGALDLQVLGELLGRRQGQLLLRLVAVELGPVVAPGVDHVADEAEGLPGQNGVADAKAPLPQLCPVLRYGIGVASHPAAQPFHLEQRHFVFIC